MSFDPCGVESNRAVPDDQADAGLPWPLSLKLMPDDIDAGTHHARDGTKAPRPMTSSSGKTKLCQAWFKYREHSKELQWQGPEGGNDLIRQVRGAFDLSDDKLVYLIDPRTRDVVDIDSELSENVDYEVRIEPEDPGPLLNIVPCLLNLCTFRYAAMVG
mmetsp:Transcript_3391/g.8595  ORF Transcript_3391/g.8595 Transcript_3391/m.8595 type:complete len:159 (-) Transcript_3391:7-483(-)